jgi:hypothetical protein
MLFCLDCGDIVAPLSTARKPRFCACQRHAVWWENPATGVLRIHDTQGVFDPPNPNYVGGPDAQPQWQRKHPPHMAYIIGLHNRFLTWEKGHSKESVAMLLDSTPDSYIFRRINSLVIRIRPGESNDTDWAERLP